ncbi:hypothetical protein ABT052_02195 [Streptomyces sp. NPDC002766]|uniref:COG4315 family predicted lipoprotein n=1 Tax=Streptomyces sp. NPDC002766 TaxID=3154429 RepID=UPI00331775BB
MTGRRLPQKGNPVIPHRIVLASATGLIAAFLLAACSSAGSDASGTGSGTVAPAAVASSGPASSAPASSAPADPSPAGGAQSVTTAVRSAGGTVTDGSGMTLYRYDRDRPNPSRWTCSGACVKTWIPVIVQGAVQASGVDKGLLGTVHRDGRTQLTLAGWPLYRYVGDTAAGQTNGQGRDGQWHAITPTGGRAG